MKLKLAPSEKSFMFGCLWRFIIRIGEEQDKKDWS